MKELIDRLFDARMKAVEELKSFVDERDAGWTAEDQEKYDRINADIDGKGKRIDELLELDKTNKEMDEQRGHLESVARPGPSRSGAESELEERVRAFLRGALPDAEEWAPRAIVFRFGDKEKRAAMETRDLVKGTTTAGGFTVPTGFVPRLYEHLVEVAAVRQTGAIIITTDSGEDLLVPKTTAHGSAALVAEAGAIPENDPAFGQQTLKAYKYGVLIQVAFELIQDTGVDLLGYLARQAGRALGLASGAHFVTGTGTAQPEGVQTNAVVGKQSAAGNTTSVAADDLFDLYHSIVSGYRNQGTWFTLDASLAKIRKLKDTTNQFLWQPGLQAGQPDLLLGRPVVTDPGMPVMASNVKHTLFGDFGAYYTIRDVSALRFERSEDFAFANDLVTFRALIRTDGKPIDATAVKALQNSTA